MKRFPRILSLAVAVSLLTLLAACGSSSGNSGSTGGGGSSGGGTGGSSIVALNVLIPPGQASEVSQVLGSSQAAQVAAGATFQVEWSAIDSGTGYDWSYPDGEIAALPSGKKANFVFWANSDSAEETCANGQYGTPNIGNCAIPAYVWAALGSNYATCTPANANGPQQIPDYFLPAFQTNYQNFIAAAIAHYAANSQVGYIRFGLGRGGETLPVGDWDSGDACSQQFAAWGLTDATISTTWEPYLAAMLTFEAANNSSKKQLMVGITPMGPDGKAVPDFIAMTAVPLGIGFGSQGLQASDVGNCGGSTADWCSLFGEYTGKVPLELQTLGQSCPSGTTCANQNSASTGPLPALLTFGIQNHATIFELYYQDWLTAFDPSYSGYDSSYATAFTSAAEGQ